MSDFNAALADREPVSGALPEPEADTPAVATEAVTPPAPPNGSQRDQQTGRFVRGDATAATHWLTSDRLPPELEHLRAEVGRFLAQSVIDDGGESEVPARRLSLLEYRARLHRRIVQLDAAIELRGLFDKRGRLRAAWLQQLGNYIDKARALDALLGLARRARPVKSATDIIREFDARRAQEGQR